MKRHNVDDEQFWGDGDSNDHTIGLNYFNSLPQDHKRNIIATYGYSVKNDKVVHIKLKDVDTTGLEFDDLDKWAKKCIIDMGKNRLSKNHKDQ